jgi:allophanate hydrolase subunit 2
MQVAGDGLPTILLADRPVTGGYPVISIVARSSLDAVAQLRPGQEVRFRHA